MAGSESAASRPVPSRSATGGDPPMLRHRQEGVFRFERSFDVHAGERYPYWSLSNGHCGPEHPSPPSHEPSTRFPRPLRSTGTPTRARAPHFHPGR